MEDSPKKMMRAATNFFSGTMLSRITGMFRDMAMAFAFGTEVSIAAFFVAFRFAHLFRRLFGEGALHSVFVPHFENLRKQKETSEQAVGFFIDLYAVLSLILILIIGIGMFLCGAMLNDSFGEWSSSSKEIAYLCLLMLPSLFFICLAGLNASLLQCEHSYFLPSASPIAFNAIWIAGVITLRNTASEDAMPKLALYVVAACFFQWLVTIPKVVGILRQSLFSCSLWNRIKTVNPFSVDVRRLWKPFLLGIVGIGAAQINSAFDAVFANYAESSGPAYLWYAIRLQQLPLALFGIALSGALLPPLTRAIAAEDIPKSHLLFDEAIKRSLLLIMPITALIFLVGRRSIDLLYGYGDFVTTSIDGTKACLFGYGAGLLPMTLVLIMAPAFYARNNYRLPSMIAAASIVVNLVLNVIFVMGLGWGAFSIALGTTLSAWINMVFLAIFMEHPMQKVLCQSFSKSLKMMSGALILASFITYCASLWIPLGGSFVMKGFCLGALVLIFSSVFASGYYLCLFALKAVYSNKI